MKRLSLIVVVLQLVLAGGCQVAPYEVVNIDIAIYDDFDSNIHLAEDIVRYDLRYLAAKVPAYNESIGRNISFGASADTSGSERAFVWIRYEYKGPGIISKKADLKRGLRAYFTSLAESHARMAPVFDTLKSGGSDWIETLFSANSTKQYDDFSAAFRATMPPEEWPAFCEETRRRFGVPVEIRFVGGQFYEPYNSNPEMISLFYLVKLLDEKELLIRISEGKDAGEWVVRGIGVYPEGQS